MEAVTVTATKKCSKCEQDKDLTQFYMHKGRAGSWCKGCANKGRTQYKKSARKVDYTIVNKAIMKRWVLRPTTCPDCETPDIPSIRMRGRLDVPEGKTAVELTEAEVKACLKWSCLDCRMDSLREQRASGPPREPRAPRTVTPRAPAPPKEMTEADLFDPDQIVMVDGQKMFLVHCDWCCEAFHTVKKRTFCKIVLQV